jgi:hypothetical protein
VIVGAEDGFATATSPDICTRKDHCAVGVQQSYYYDLGVCVIRIAKEKSQGLIRQLPPELIPAFQKVLEMPSIRRYTKPQSDKSDVRVWTRLRPLLVPRQTVTNDSYPAVKPPAGSRSPSAETQSSQINPR